MSTAAASAKKAQITHGHRRSVLLVLCCTLFGAAAQILIKYGASSLPHPGLSAMLTNPHLVVGYSLYGFSTVLLVLALKDGELSILYPVIALTYVWVTVLSVAFFREAMDLAKVAGISSIVLGVAILGKDGRK